MDARAGVFDWVGTTGPEPANGQRMIGRLDAGSFGSTSPHRHKRQVVSYE
jgi:hypothetical protein